MKPVSQLDILDFRTLIAGTKAADGYKDTLPDCPAAAPESSRRHCAVLVGKTMEEVPKARNQRGRRWICVVRSEYRVQPRVAQKALRDQLNCTRVQQSVGVEKEEILSTRYARPQIPAAARPQSALVPQYARTVFYGHGGRAVLRCVIHDDAFKRVRGKLVQP
jgi:hypothetical protein